MRPFTLSEARHGIRVSCCCTKPHHGLDVTQKQVFDLKLLQLLLIELGYLTDLYAPSQTHHIVTEI